MLNAVLKKETGELMEYRHIMKNSSIANSTVSPTAKN